MLLPCYRLHETASNSPSVLEIPVPTTQLLCLEARPQAPHSAITALFAIDYMELQAGSASQGREGAQVDKTE